MCSMRILTLTTLFPNAHQPAHGIFVENRLAHLVASGKVAARVVAPVAWVPDLPFLPERYRRLGGVPAREERHGIVIDHPRYLLPPKVGMLWAPLSLYRAARRAAAALAREGFEFDLIDAHYFYPDGVAAALLARHLGKPLIITARGSDVTQLPDYRLPRAMIRWAAGVAAGIVTVSQSLKDGLVALGVPAEKIRVLRNGVDLQAFRPVDRAAARAALGIEGTLLLSVGHLIPRKGHDLAIAALAQLPDATLVIVGEGPEEGRLKAAAVRLGVAPRVRFLGARPHGALAALYSAADLLLLLSTREGWANVLLEAMACGTPVVATPAGGTPEVLASPVAGELVMERDPAAVAAAVTRLLARRPAPAAVHAYAEGFSWDATTEGQLALMAEVLGGQPSSLTVNPMGRRRAL